MNYRLLAGLLALPLCCGVSIAQSQSALTPANTGTPVAAPTAVPSGLPSATRPQEILPALRKVNQEARALSASEGLNPFTGGSTQYEDNARLLQLERQRTAILREKQNQAQSLSDMTRMVTPPSQPMGTPVGFPSNQGFSNPNAPALTPTRPAPRRIIQRPAQTAKRINPRVPAVAAASPAAPALAAAPSAELLGVAVVDGQKYALVTRGTEQFSIPEHQQARGVRVGEVRAGDAEVNGHRQLVNLTRQEIVVHSSTKQAAPNANLPATAVIAPAVPNAPASDMRTLRLPTLPAPGQALGPQPYPTGVRTQ